MRSAIILCLAVAIVPVGILCAHEPETLPTAEPRPLLPIPAKPALSEQDIDHLMKAAHHLDSAGLKEEAQQLRRVARERALKDNVISRKEEELECLLAEIDELRHLAGVPRTVMIRVAAIEFSRAALGDKAADLDAILGRHSLPEANDEPERGHTMQAAGIPGYKFKSNSLADPRRATTIEFSRAAVDDKTSDLDAILGRNALPKAKNEPQRRPKEQATEIPGHNFNSNPPPEPRRATIQASASRRASGSSFSLVEGNPLAHPTIRELQQNGLIKILAEPTVITASGRPVEFLSGGQMPVPVNSKSADGKFEIKWKPFGVQLKARAAVLSERRVRVHANFEISEKDLLHVVNVEGVPVPGLSTRGINTEVELRFGQTAVLGGLKSRGRSSCEVKEGLVERFVSSLTQNANVAKSTPSPSETDDLREMVFFITAESADLDLPPPRTVQAMPSELDPDEMRRLLSPPGVPDDVQYFPASPIPRKGTLR